MATGVIRGSFVLAAAVHAAEESTPDAADAVTAELGADLDAGLDVEELVETLTDNPHICNERIVSRDNAQSVASNNCTGT